MTTKIYDGGPAFPAMFEGGANNGESPAYNEGISLRDNFAIQALVGLGTWMPVPAYGAPSLHSPEVLKARAEIAYAQADAMLAARSRDGGAE